MTSDPPSFTDISTVGEFGLIDRMKSLLSADAEAVVVGIGDDAAAVTADNGTLTLITTDALIEHIHFDRTYTPMRHLGFKAVSVNVSDIVAMNGAPRFATVALGIPNTVSIEMVDELYAGLQDAATEFGLSVIGGDTCASPKLMLSITLIGDCDSASLSKRSGAEPGDLLGVTGTLGASYAGLRILQFHKQRMLEEGSDYHPDLSSYASVIERHLRPKARTDVAAAMRAADFVPKAMIDLSDGLASDIRHLCRASGCGVDVDLSSIPISSETESVASLLEDPVEQYALRGGEDYELLFAADASREETLRSMPDVHVVGKFISADRGLRITLNGVSEDLGRLEGFRHF